MPEQIRKKSGHNPLVLGVTGGPGTGKSTVTRMLASLGAQTADADAMVRWAYNRQPFRNAVAKRFGPGVLDASGGIDRTALARIVFQDPAAREDLERLVHPAVLNQCVEMIQAYRNEPERDPMLALEIPLLYEAGAEAIVDRVLVVTAPREVVEQRLAERGWDADRIAAVQSAQIPLEEKASRADDVLDTSGSLEETAKRVEALWDRLVTPG